MAFLISSLIINLLDFIFFYPSPGSLAVGETITVLICVHLYVEPWGFPQNLSFSFAVQIFLITLIKTCSSTIAINQV